MKNIGLLFARQAPSTPPQLQYPTPPGQTAPVCQGQQKQDSSSDAIHLLARLLDLLQHGLVRHIALDHYPLFLKADVVRDPCTPLSTLASPPRDDRAYLPLSTVPELPPRSTPHKSSKDGRVPGRVSVFLLGLVCPTLTSNSYSPYEPVSASRSRLGCVSTHHCTRWRDCKWTRQSKLYNAARVSLRPPASNKTADRVTMITPWLCIQNLTHLRVSSESHADTDPS